MTSTAFQTFRALSFNSFTYVLLLLLKAKEHHLEQLPGTGSIYFAFSSLLPGKKQNPFHTGGNPAGSPREVGRFALRNFCRVFRRQLAVVRSKGSYEQASAGRSCGLPIRPRRIENLPAAAARSRSFPYLLFLMSAYSVKSAFGSWSTLFIGTTSMP